MGGILYFSKIFLDERLTRPAIPPALGKLARPRSLCACTAVRTHCARLCRLCLRACLCARVCVVACALLSTRLVVVVGGCRSLRVGYSRAVW